MKWRQFTVYTTSEAEDLVVLMLSELGFTGAEIRDTTAIMDGDTIDLFKDVMPELPEDDGKAEILFYAEEDADPEEIMARVRSGLSDLSAFTDIGEGRILEGETEDVDWVNNWKQHFHAFVVAGVLIKPTWIEELPDEPWDIMVEIDPGTAFGTGSHETTKLCIEGLRKELKPGMTVLDVGTGSGILGIISHKMGASYVFGTDIDDMAVRTARDNIQVNGIPAEDFEVITGNIIDDREIMDAAGYEKYDVVVANILADIIIPLQKVVPAQMKKDGKLIVSGIINSREEDVKKALLENPALELIDSEHQGEWVSFILRKK